MEEWFICNSFSKHLFKRDLENKVFPYCTAFGETDLFLVHINIPPTISATLLLQSCLLSVSMIISQQNIASTLLNVSLEFINLQA